MNILLFVGLLLCSFALSLWSFHLGRRVMFAFIGAISSLTFFLAPVVVDIFGFPFAIGEIFYATLFLSTDILAEHYGKSQARKVIWLVVIIGITISIFTQVAVMFDVHDSGLIAGGGEIQGHLRAFLEISPRLLLAGFVMFIVEQQFDIWFFHKLKQIFQGRKLWLRNCLSTGASQLIDVLFLYPLAFYGIYDNLIQLMITAFVFKICMALLDTPFIYLSKLVMAKKRC